jgi:hypothetical protein
MINEKKYKEITDHILNITNPLNEYNLANYPHLDTKDYENIARAALTLFQRRREHLARMKPEGITALVRVALRHANNANANATENN